MVKLKKKAGVAKRVRRQHTGAFKARVALAALREDKTMAQLCQDFDLHANQITEWKRQLQGLQALFQVTGAGLNRTSRLVATR